mmetsp:Transcript_34472/g.41243  ORF Transcript_34472/g.41243 Transcript_34472/m.41243 type:complete len:383 (-) Transcript_34472:507-1655(-)
MKFENMRIGKAKKSSRYGRLIARSLYFVATIWAFQYILLYKLRHELDEPDVINTSAHETGISAVISANDDVASKSILDCNNIINADIPAYRDNPQVTFRRTVTKPPFYISLHNYTIDHVRWMTIMDKGYYYETGMYNAMHEALKDFKDNPKEAIVLDIGGNIGWFTLIAASLGHRVLTFEPNNINNIKLCESLQMNGWLHKDKNLNLVEIYEAGVGDKHGEVLDLYNWPAKKNPGRATFSASQRNEAAKKVGSMPMLSMDQIAEGKGWFESRPNIAFVKVDVEGYELNVLRGLSKMIKAKLIKNIIFEFKTQIKSDEELNLNLLQALIDSGYELYKKGGPNGPDTVFTQEFKSGRELFTILSDPSIKLNKHNQNLWWRLVKA